MVDVSWFFSCIKFQLPDSQRQLVFTCVELQNALLFNIKYYFPKRAFHFISFSPKGKERNTEGACTDRQIVKQMKKHGDTASRESARFWEGLSLKKLVSVCPKSYESMNLSLRTLIFYPQSSFQRTYITEISDPEHQYTRSSKSLTPNTSTLNQVFTFVFFFLMMSKIRTRFSIVNLGIFIAFFDRNHISHTNCCGGGF